MKFSVIVLLLIFSSNLSSGWPDWNMFTTNIPVPSSDVEFEERILGFWQEDGNSDSGHMIYKNRAGEIYFQTISYNDNLDRFSLDGVAYKCHLGSVRSKAITFVIVSVFNEENGSYLPYVFYFKPDGGVAMNGIGSSYSSEDSKFQVLKPDESEGGVSLFKDSDHLQTYLEQYMDDPDFYLSELFWDYERREELQSFYRPSRN